MTPSSRESAGTSMLKCSSSENWILTPSIDPPCQPITNMIVVPGEATSTGAGGGAPVMAAGAAGSSATEVTVPALGGPGSSMICGPVATPGGNGPTVTVPEPAKSMFLLNSDSTDTMRSSIGAQAIPQPTKPTRNRRACCHE